MDYTELREDVKDEIEDLKKRIRSLEEAIPNYGTLRGLADVLEAHKHPSLSDILHKMADRIEYLMNRNQT